MSVSVGGQISANAEEKFTQRLAAEIGRRLIALEKAVRGAAGDIFTSPGAPAFGGGTAGAPGVPGAPGTPGATDHGALTGLLDDDHPQYVQHGEPVRALPHSHIIHKLDDVDDVDAGAAIDADVLFWYAARGKWVAAVTPDGNTGSTVTGFGRLALQTNTGSFVTAFGTGALFDNSGDYCSAFGQGALQNNDGANNTAIGFRAASYPGGVYANRNLAGAQNTFLGMESGSDSATQRSNSTVVGYRALYSADNQVVLGNAAVTEVQAGTGGVATVKCAAVNLAGVDLATTLAGLQPDSENSVIAHRMFGG